MSEPYLAFDLGAESGRAMAVSIDDRRIALTEVHRFPNGPVRVPLGGADPGGLGAPAEAVYWDALQLWQEI